MRSLNVVLLVALVWAPLGCKQKRVPPQAVAEGAVPELASTVHMGDPKLAEQLVTGFHQIEANAWRWTARQFTVVLRPPAGSAQNGATLQVHLTVPPVTIEKLAGVTLSANVRDTALAPESYSKAGDYVYQRDIPAGVFRSGSVRVEFQLDKAIPPTGADMRELGIVVKSIGLALK